MMDDEQIVLLDESLQPIGGAPKLASHHAHTPLHLAFSCYVFDSGGKLLVSRRALAKKVWPGVWTNSFCGHPAPGESLEDAIRRRGQAELGIDELKDVQCVLPDYRYTTPPFNGIIENEFCPVYVARYDGSVTPNPDEVDSYEFMSWDTFRHELVDRADDYSYWCKEQAPQINDFVIERVI